MSLVTLLNTKQFICSAETTLLDAARTQGLVLEHSCRTGRCGICKTKVIRGDTHPIKFEEALTVEDIQSGHILTCCRTAMSDVELDTEDLGRLGAIKVQVSPCKIDAMNKLAPDVLQIILRLPPQNNFDYMAGQYINVIAKDGVRRSYSIANSPQKNTTSPHNVELHIREVGNGTLSNYWFHEAKTNDLLRLEGPLGTFCFRDKPAKNIIFLATGTGIAPIKSILEDLQANDEQCDAKNIYIYWGGRTPQDIYWQPLFENLKINFHPVLSRADTQWLGRRGYVQDALLADNIDMENSVVYACGADKMIHAAKTLLTLRGLNPQHFFSDAFVSSK